MERSYKPWIDNYMLSMQAQPRELWRNHLQLLYDNMKISVTDPIAIDGQYFDMHDEFSDTIDMDFGVNQGVFLVGLRRIASQDFIPDFLRLHKEFLDNVQKLSPYIHAASEERYIVSLKILENHKELIDKIKKSKESAFDMQSLLKKIPEEFGLREIIENDLIGYRSKMDCFRYPRCQMMPTTDYSAALGDYHIFREVNEEMKGKALAFIPPDEPFNENTYPGLLGSYQSRLKFADETIQRADLVALRERKMTDFLKRSVA